MKLVDEKEFKTSGIYKLKRQYPEVQWLTPLLAFLS